MNARSGAGRGIGKLNWVMVGQEGERKRTVPLIARELLAWLGHLTNPHSCASHKVPGLSELNMGC